MMGKATVMRIAAIVVLMGLGLGGVSKGTDLASDCPTLQGFATGGHTIYHLRCTPLVVDESPVLIAAALDGSVLCYTPAGQLLWKNTSNSSMPLDLDVADVDGDGRAETFIAAGDGSLYVIDHLGKLRWRFHREPPLLQVCVVRNAEQDATILTGGIERKLYALDATGHVRDVLELPYIVRHIRSGDFVGDGRQRAAVITAKNDRSRFFLQLYAPQTLEPQWQKPLGLSTDNPTEGTKFLVPWLAYRVAAYSVLPLDVTGDGAQEVLLTDDFGKRGVFYAFDGQGDKVLTSSTRGIRGRPYRMNRLTHAPLGDGERIVGLFGNQIIAYRLDGSIERIATGPYSLACADFDSGGDTLYLGSSISGGDGIYALRLDHADWDAAFASMKPVGRMAEVERNLATLADQVDRFCRPDYQSLPKKSTVITGASADELDQLYRSQHEYANLSFVQFNLFTEDYDRDQLAPPWNTTRESRHKYNYRAEEIVAWAAEREARNEPFALWAGHGNDPFYMQRSTIAAVLKAAPTTARALVFPEMERTDEAMEYAVRTHLIPIAEMCRQHGRAKVVLRNKNIFWNGSCYLDLWREFLLSGEYSDIFVPSMEETNGRTQAISLSGRMGLWLCGHFDQLSARAVTDNANFSRLWEWSSQQCLSHLLRSLAYRCSLGAQTMLVNIYQGDPRQLTPLYRMVDKGVIAVPSRDDLLSVADVCLGMKTPSESFLSHGKNGHNISGYAPAPPAAVFDRMDCYWGGAPTTDSDFSHYAMGSERRTLNFLPTFPYGLIASVPQGTKLDVASRFRAMLVTDGQVFYDRQGNAVPAAAYREIALEQLEASAARLPVRVVGDAAWTVVRLDPTHVRVTLIDPGYVSPAARDVNIVLQHLEGTGCRDILSGDTLPLSQNSVQATIPAGSLRVLDIVHR